MKVYRGLAELPGKRPPAAIAIGNFVGVHLGHRAIIRRLVEVADETQSVPTAVTFDPHPQKVLRGTAPCALATRQTNEKLLADAGIEREVILRFNRALSLVEPEEFIERILVEELNVKAIVVGSDFTFGHFARGDVTMLRSFGRRHGFAVDGLRLARLSGRRLSSTEIRHALAEGDLSWATKALGRPHLLPGKIVRGRGRGEKLLGFPTANLEVAPGICLPKIGIYAGRVALGERRFAAAISVGTNPQFGRNPVSVEAFLLDFRGKLYGKKAEFELAGWIRNEKVFSSTGALSRAIEKDVEAVRRILGE